MDREIPSSAQPTRRSIAIDFDGVIHSYTSPWRGDPCFIDDAPVPGAIEWLTEMVGRFDVFVFSCRLLTSRRTRVERAMRIWLHTHGCGYYVIDALHFTHEKPHADIYIDDRAVRFEGTFPTLEQIAEASVPWNRRRGA